MTRLVEPHWDTIQRFEYRIGMTMTVVIVVLQLHVRESSMVVIIRLLLPASRSRIISTRVWKIECQGKLKCVIYSTFMCMRRDHIDF